MSYYQLKIYFIVFYHILLNIFNSHLSGHGYCLYYILFSSKCSWFINLTYLLFWRTVITETKNIDVIRTTLKCRLQITVVLTLKRKVCVACTDSWKRFGFLPLLHIICWNSDFWFLLCSEIMWTITFLSRSFWKEKYLRFVKDNFSAVPRRVLIFSIVNSTVFDY